MVDTAAKLATYQDLLDLPENRVGEIIHGAVKDDDPVALAPFDAAPFRLGTLWPD